MPIHPAHPAQRLSALLPVGVLCACTGDLPGTQVGIEDSLRCEEVSSEVVTDPDAVPEDFTAAPADLLADATGTFTGDQLDEDEAPTGDLATLTVSDPGGDLRLVRYEVHADHDGGEEDLGHLCPPAVFVDLDYAFEADGLPTYAATLSTRIDGDGDVWAESDDDGGFAEALPEPTAFDPDAFDTVVPRILFSGGAGTWWGTVSWLAWNADDVEDDGDVYMESEVLVMARLVGG